MAVDQDKINNIAKWALPIIGLFVIFGGALQLRSHLFATDRSLARQAREEALATEDTSNLSAEERQLADLQNQDTDSDGLSDFDEQYIYATSQYLEDTDSDGVNDSQEIAQGTNPNCPEGDDCLQQRIGGDEIVSDASGDFSGLSPDTAQFSNLSADELREQLVGFGVSEDDLAEISDEDLLAVYQDVLADQNQGSSVSTNVVEEAEALRALTVEQKRNFLVESGLDSADVASLSDDEVNGLIEQSIQAVLGELEVSEQAQAQQNTTDQTTP